MLLRILFAALFSVPPLAADSRGPLEPSLLSVEAYTETFTFIADLENGTYVQAQLFVSNVGVGSARGGCRLLVVRPAQAPWTMARVVNRRDWKHEPGTVPSLSIGPCRVSAEGDRVRVRATPEAGEIELSIEAPLGRTLPPDHTLRTSNGAIYSSEILIPWASVHAELRVPPLEVQRLQGNAYADHSISTALPADMARGWVRFRALGGACPSLLLARVPARDEAQRGWLWRRATSGPEACGISFAWPPALQGTPASLSVTACDNTIRFDLIEQLYRYAPTEEMGVLGKIVSAWTGRVVTTTYRAAAEGLPGCDRTLGLLELTRVD